MEYEKEWQKVRERNLKINIAKQLIISGLTERKTFTRQELKDIFSFKESDVLYIAPDLFDIREDGYAMTSEVTDFVDKVVRSNKTVKEYLTAAEAECDMYRAYAGNKCQKVFSKLKEIIPIIHWGRLPIFNKYLLYNREKNLN